MGPRYPCLQGIGYGYSQSHSTAADVVLFSFLPDWANVTFSPWQLPQKGTKTFERRQFSWPAFPSFVTQKKEIAEEKRLFTQNTHKVCGKLENCLCNCKAFVFRLSVFVFCTQLRFILIDRFYGLRTLYAAFSCLSGDSLNIGRLLSKGINTSQIVPQNCTCPHTESMGNMA